MTTATATVYQLYRGDILLGILTQSVSAPELGWHGGYFEPTAEFERVRPLFESELHLLNHSRRNEWHEMWEEIQRPGLRLEPVAGGEPVTAFVIHFEQDRAWWR